MNPTPDIRLACGVVSFLCLCIIVVQLVLVAKHDSTTRSTVTEIGILRSELAKHNEETTGRLSIILTEMDIAHSKFKAINERNNGVGSK